jgi:hypothetical protein
MKIGNPRIEKSGGRARVVATVRWEDCDRPTQEVYFETDSAFSDGLSCGPHAFLVGGILPAMRHGEERIVVEGEICPELRSGLITVMNWMKVWYYTPDKKLVRIEAKTKSGKPKRTQERAGCFFSGGIDSLGTLRNNRLLYPPDHPLSIRDGVFIYGQNWESDDQPETFERAVKELSEVTRDAGITLIPVYTNVRYLDEESEFFQLQFHGAVLAAVAHALAERFSAMLISSSSHIPDLFLRKRKNFLPWGSHPVIDPCYSCTDMRIRHEDTALSRFDKVRLISRWDAGLQNIKVCPPNYPGDNCGVCEKCIRTELGLLASGVLDKTRAFPLNDICADLISNLHLNEDKMQFYLELLQPLSDIGRHDLVRAIEQCRKNLEKKESRLKKRMRQYELGMKSKVKQFDSKYLNGYLLRFKRSLPDSTREL